MTESFALFDCSLARFAVGQRCSNLRELLEALRTAPDKVVEHHMMRCALEDHFELDEFPNDFARWCWHALGDRALGEEVGLVDPYQHSSVDSLRAALVALLEDHLWEVDRVPWCRPGLELHLVGSRLIAYDTGERLPTLAALAEAVPRMSRRSLFLHVHEARHRTGGRTDDFSAWLAAVGGHDSLIARLRRIDFNFLNLGQLRTRLIEVFAQGLSEEQALLQGQHAATRAV
ncbi:MAG: DUF5752 family protein [Planctomycetota bacterium]